MSEIDIKNHDGIGVKEIEASVRAQLEAAHNRAHVDEVAEFFLCSCSCDGSGSSCNCEPVSS